MPDQTYETASLQRVGLSPNFDQVLGCKTRLVLPAGAGPGGFSDEALSLYCSDLLIPAQLHDHLVPISAAPRADFLFQCGAVQPSGHVR